MSLLLPSWLQVDALEREDRQRRPEQEERRQPGCPRRADDRAWPETRWRASDAPGRPVLHVGERVGDVLHVVGIELVGCCARLLVADPSV